MEQAGNLWLVGLVALGAASLVLAGDGYLSPSALVADQTGQTLYVAEATARQVAVFDIATAAVTRTFSLPDPPTGLALAPDQSRLYVTGASPKGQLFIINLQAGKLEAQFESGHTLTAPVVSLDGKTLYVCSRFKHTVSVIDLASGEVSAALPVSREPVAVALTPDGKLLFVANLLPAGPSNGDYTAAVVSVIDTAAAFNRAPTTIPLPNGSTGLRGICVSPDGKHAYVTHILARYHLPTTQLERGWVNTNALSVIDVKTRTLINTVLLDQVDLGAANPWGVACTADGKHVCVTHAGTHELSVIDRTALHDKLARAAAGERVTDVSKSADDVPDDLSFLVGVRRRIKLGGNGPRGLAIVGSTVYVAEYFSDTIGIVDINPQTRSKPRSRPLGSRRPDTAALRGEMLFHDAGLCFQQWQSCASCHPDGRVDGLNWDLLNDGIGNPKNTRSMLLAHETPPAMSTGVRDNAEIAVRNGIRYIQFAVRPEEDAAAIDEYLKSIKPVPSPYLVNGELSESATRGRAIFTQAGCAECHPHPLHTDMESYDVGTAVPAGKDREFDTPTLIEAWRTAPYLHDGRSVTIKELLTRHNADDKHGTTSKLSEEQISDLAAFVLSQ